MGQLCRTLGRSRPAASLGRPGGPEWAQFVLIPRSLAGTALRPSWKGDAKRVPAILGSVGGPCRERVWPPPGLLADCKIAPGDSQTCFVLVRNCTFPFLILIFPERSDLGNPWDSSGNHYWPSPPWKPSVASLPRGRGPVCVFLPMVSKFAVATPHLTHGVSLPPP